MSLDKKTLLIRADANAHIGTGHLMRCLALAQAWQAQGGEAIFITACDSVGLLQRLKDEKFRVVMLGDTYPNPDEWEITAQVLTDYPNAWVVLDGYHFDGVYQQRVKDAGQRLLVIDDMAHLEHYYADVVLNQNLYAEQLHYACDPDTRLLLGTRYALLRREFWLWREWRREIPEVACKVLVTLGGSDPDNVTLKVIQALQFLEMPDLEAIVVVGGSNPHYESLQAAVTSTPWIQLVRNVHNIPELMAWADVAISAAGSTCWELALMGLPSLLIVLAENQRPIATGMVQAHAAFNLGEHSTLTAAHIAKTLRNTISQVSQRKTFSQHSRALIDGQGSQRVANFLQRKLSLRPVQTTDSALIWGWANDAVTRAASFTSDAIPWETHVTWFAERLNDPHCSFYLAFDASGVPVGQIRYQLEGEAATVSVSVAPERRGNGCGTALIQAGTQQLLADTSIKHIHAYIKPENIASMLAFQRAGFIEIEMTSINGLQACHLVYERGMAK